MQDLTKADWFQRLSGETVFVIGSGPSLTEADCEAVHESGLQTLVTNTTFRRCPWAHILIAHDSRWWTEYRAEVDEVFHGARVSCTNNGRALGIHSLRLMAKFRGFGNSGCAAISLAALGKARRVVLLGVDCQRTGGQTHWHGDHPSSLSNARTLDRWPEKFSQVGRYAASKGCEVVNATRETALSCFPRVRLEDELSGTIAATADRGHPTSWIPEPASAVTSQGHVQE